MQSSSPHTNESKRSVLVKKNILAGIVIKGWSALTVLLTVPLTLDCLDVYQNGIWLTISSILVWIDMFDVGLGSGLRNQLTIDIAEGNMIKARQTVSSTIAMLSLIMICALAIIIALIHWCDVYSFINADPLIVKDLPKILITATSIVSLTFVLKLIGNVYMSYQIPAVSSLLVALGQTLALIGTFILNVTQHGSLASIALINTASPLLVYLISYPITFYKKFPQLRPSFSFISMIQAKRMMNLGFQFFVLQISSIILFLSSNLIISRLYSPELVNPYQISYRFFSLILILFTVICVPLWNATTDAFAKHDILWIKQANRKMRYTTLAMIALISVMFGLARWVYSIWIGDAVFIPTSVSLTMGAYIAIIISSMRYSYFLNGIGALRLQLFTTLFAAILFIVLSHFAASFSNDITWLIIVLCAVNLPGLVINHIQFHRIINDKAEGIWRK